LILILAHSLNRLRLHSHGLPLDWTTPHLFRTITSSGMVLRRTCDLKFLAHNTLRFTRTLSAGLLAGSLKSKALWSWPHSHRSLATVGDSLFWEFKETFCVFSSATFILDCRTTWRIEGDYCRLLVGASKKPGPDNSTSDERIAILEYAIPLQKSERGGFHERVGLVIINQNVLRFSKAPIKNIEIR
jgi:hypothetical protein